MTASVRKIVNGEIVLVEPSEPACWINPNFGGEPALFYAHDCIGNGLSIDPYRFRSEGVLSCDKYPRTDDGNSPVWTIVSENPLTVSPSILCGAKDCDTHGFFREGVWVKA